MGCKEHLTIFYQDLWSKLCNKQNGACTEDMTISGTHCSCLGVVKYNGRSG